MAYYNNFEVDVEALSQPDGAVPDEEKVPDSSASTTDDEFVVSFSATDPENPKNMSKFRKWVVVLTVSWTSVAV